MPELSVIIQWMNQYPKTGWLLLCIYIALGVVRHRVINAESGSVFRGLLNLRKRRLEQMLTQPYSNKNAVRLAKRELRQRSLYRLTGLYNYRLQDLAVIMCDRYGVRLVISSRGVTGSKNGMDGLCSTGNGIVFAGVFFW